MNTTRNQSVIDLAARIFILMSMLVLLIAGREVFVPLTFALFFSFLLLPISERLEKFKVPRAIAIIISIIIAMIFFVAVIYFFIDQLDNFRKDIPRLKNEFAEKGTSLLSWIESNTSISQEKQIGWLKEKLATTADSTPKILVGIFSSTGSIIALTALIPLYIFFLTYFKDKYRKFLLLVVRNNHRQALDIVKKISQVSRNYLKGVFLDVLILSILGSVGYMLIGLEHAILFGVLAALLNIIPYVGALVGGALPILMAFITKDEIGFTLGAAGVAAAVQFIDNNFIAPYVIGSSVSINPLTAIVVLISGALIWGVAGMILSIPLAGMLKVIFDNIDGLKPYGFLIGEEVNYNDSGFFAKTKTKKS